MPTPENGLPISRYTAVLTSLYFAGGVEPKRLWAPLKFFHFALFHYFVHLFPFLLGICLNHSNTKSTTSTYCLLDSQRQTTHRTTLKHVDVNKQKEGNGPWKAVQCALMVSAVCLAMHPGAPRSILRMLHGEEDRRTKASAVCPRAANQRIHGAVSCAEDLPEVAVTVDVDKEIATADSSPPSHPSLTISRQIPRNFVSHHPMKGCFDLFFHQ